MKKFMSILCVVALATLYGCRENDNEYKANPGGKENPDADAVEVRFQLKMPGASYATTRALQEEDEYDIQTIDLLLFKVTTYDGSGITYDAFVAHAEGENPTVDANDNHLYTFTARIKAASQQNYQAVVLANARAEVEDLINNGTLTVGMNRSEVLQQIQFNLPVTGWKATDSSDFRPFPMWGQSGIVQVSDNDTPASWGPISLLRAIARVDIGLGYTTGDFDNEPQGIANFKLKEVWVYNAQTKGQVAPAKENYDALKIKVTYPTLPAGIGKPHTFLNTGTNDAPATPYLCADGAYQITRSIYLPEARLMDADKTTATCLIVGGEYGGDTDVSYYRVDFFDPTTGEEKQRMDILRNHRYRFNIRKVSGPGYTTPDEAFDSNTINMEVNIIPWNESNLNVDVVPNEEQYSLILSTNTVNLYRDQTFAGMMTVTSDYPMGWTVEAPESDAWFEVSPETVNTDAPTDLIIKPLSDFDGSILTREAIFYVKAGRLQKPVKVIQHNTNAPMQLILEPEKLEFTRDGQGPLKVNVTTHPAGVIRNISSTSAAILWRQNFGPVDYTGTAATELLLHPEAFQGAKSELIMVTIDDNGERLIKFVSAQIHDESMKLVSETSSPYSYKAGTYNFKVTYSDTPWWLTYADNNPENMISNASVDTEYPALSFGATPRVLSFNFTANPTFEERTAVLDVNSNDPNFSEGAKVSLVQQGHAPVLDVTQPAPTSGKYILDFGNTYTPSSSVSFQVLRNADLALTYDANYANVSTTAKLAEQTYANDATVSENTVFSFNPVAITGTEPRAHIAKTTVKVSTTNTGTQPAITKDIEIWRRVPQYFRDFSFANTVSPHAGTVSATATTNTKWRVTVSGQTAKESPGDDNSTANQTVSSIPYPDAPGDLWSGTRNISAKIEYKSYTNSTDGGWVTYSNANLVQDAYSLSATASPTSLPEEAGTVSVALSGSYPAGTLQLKYGNNVLSAVSIAKGTSTTTNLGYTQNTTSDARSLTLNYAVTSTKTNRGLGTLTQAKPKNLRHSTVKDPSTGKTFDTYIFTGGDGNKYEITLQSRDLLLLEQERYYRNVESATSCKSIMAAAGVMSHENWCAQLEGIGWRMPSIAWLETIADDRYIDKQGNPTPIQWSTIKALKTPWAELDPELMVALRKLPWDAWQHRETPHVDSEQDAISKVSSLFDGILVADTENALPVHTITLNPPRDIWHHLYNWPSSSKVITTLRSNHSFPYGYTYDEGKGCVWYKIAHTSKCKVYTNKPWEDITWVIYSGKPIKQDPEDYFTARGQTRTGFVRCIRKR